MVLMVEKGIGAGICHSISRYAKANDKYIKDYDKNKELSFLKYWDIDKLHGWGMSQELRVNDFEWADDEGFIKNYNAKSKEGYFL